ncbi:MAG TPA: hypothetical protein VER55_04390 [Ardenticatenaceae bacterium]|nr:hypothetical protein [Ardenticatenaceae bacterium]
MAQRAASGFGALLRWYRRQCVDPDRGGPLTQQRLGELVGVELHGAGYTGAAVSEWERARSQIHHGNRPLLVALLKVLHACGGLHTLEEANALLAAGNYRHLNADETHQIFPVQAAVPQERPPAPDEVHHRQAEGLTGEPSTPARGLPDEGEVIGMAAPGDGPGGDVPRAAPPGIPAPERPQRWYTRVVRLVAALQSALEPAERQGTLGAIILATLFVGLGWRSPATRSGNSSELILVATGLLAGTVVLAIPPSPFEIEVQGRRWLRRKLYRLSGTARGVVYTGGLLLACEAIDQVLSDGLLTRPIVFLLAALGTTLAFAIGADLQHSFFAHPERRRLHPRTLVRRAAVMILAQILLIPSLISLLQGQWNSAASVFVVLPAAAMLLNSTRRSRRQSRSE